MTTLMTRRTFVRAAAMAVPATAAATLLAGTAEAATSQGGWAWCRKCSSTFYAGPLLVAQGSCAAGGIHAVPGTDYIAPIGYTSADFQPGFRWCVKCNGMCFAQFNKSGAQRCPGGGLHNLGNTPYTMPHGVVNAKFQNNWHVCGPCGMYFYANNSLTGGRCTATGAAHHATNGTAYQMVYA